MKKYILTFLLLIFFFNLCFSDQNIKMLASPFTRLGFAIKPSTPYAKRLFAIKYGTFILIDHVETNSIPKEFISSIIDINPDAYPTIYYSLSEIKKHDPILSKMDERWFVHCYKNPQERLIYAPRKWRNFLADISEPSYRRFWIKRVKNVFKNKPYRALFIDVAPATHTIRYWFSCAPEKWHTQKEFNISWRKWTITFLKEIKKSFPSKIIIVNSVRTNYYYKYGEKYAGYDFAQYVDGICIEPWLYPKRDSYSGRKWKDMMNQLIHVLHKRKWVVVSLEHPNIHLNSQQLLYGLASFLLIRTEHLVYTKPSIDIQDEKLFIPLGKPKDKLKKNIDGYFSNGVYVRTYENGLVLVNPSKVRINYSLPKPMNSVILNGNNVSYIKLDKLTLPPTSGAILIDKVINERTQQGIH